MARGDMKYRTIVADPPWQYRNKHTGGSHTSGAIQKYRVMQFSEIASLPVSSIAHRDCVLFLWATTPLLPEAFRVLNAWGFRYKTAIYWLKTSMGMGYWFRGKVEVCLVGVRGRLRAFRCQRPNVVESRPRRHSQKPEEFFRLVEPIVPRPRLELFARAARPGWDTWGDQAHFGITAPWEASA